MPDDSPRFHTDDDGTWEVFPLPSGAERRVLVEPSAAYLAAKENLRAQLEAQERREAAAIARRDILERVAAVQAEKVVEEWVLEGDLSPEEREEMLGAFLLWEPGLVFAAQDVGRLVRYEDLLYRVVQPHTAMEHQPPPDVPALLTPVAIPGTIEAWSPRQGGHDAYPLGHLVTHNGRIWRSEHVANVWEPGTAGAESLWTDLGPMGD